MELARADQEDFETQAEASMITSDTGTMPENLVCNNDHEVVAVEDCAAVLTNPEAVYDGDDRRSGKQVAAHRRVQLSLEKRVRHTLETWIYGLNTKTSLCVRCPACYDDVSSGPEATRSKAFKVTSRAGDDSGLVSHSRGESGSDCPSTNPSIDLRRISSVPATGKSRKRLSKSLTQLRQTRSAILSRRTTAPVATRNRRTLPTPHGLGDTPSVAGSTPASDVAQVKFAGYVCSPLARLKTGKRQGLPANAANRQDFVDVDGHRFAISAATYSVLHKRVNSKVRPSPSHVQGTEYTVPRVILVIQADLKAKLHRGGIARVRSGNIDTSFVCLLRNRNFRRMQVLSVKDKWLKVVKDNKSAVVVRTKRKHHWEPPWRRWLRFTVNFMCPFISIGRTGSVHCLM